MNTLSLHRQLVEQTRSARKRISSLDSADPSLSWFNLELRKIGIDNDSTELSLEESNARLSAMKQLMLLLRNHCIRLQNPDFAEAVEDAPDSYLTVKARLPSNVLESTRDLGFSIAPELLHKHAPDNDDFDPVSPTAKIVAYLRGLDPSLQIDGGFSPETEGASLLKGLGITEPETQQSMGVLFQSRYHTINASLAEMDHDVLQVVEFAAGISPRGYQWSRMSPGTIYLESDLPQLMVHKAKLIRNARLAEETASRGLHHCCSADVLDLQSMLQAISILDTSSPLTIITEGLLLYFGEAEMKKFLFNMKSLLSEFPNARWVTDFVTQEDLKTLFSSHPGVASGVKNVFSLTGRSVVPDNPFKTSECVMQLIANAGLSIQSSVQLSDVTSDLKLDLVDQPQREAIVGERRIWKISA